MDRDQAARLLDEVRPTHLLHFAWYAAHGKYWTSTENLRWVESSLALLRGFVERGGQRAVIAGTCAEYDWRSGFCSEAHDSDDPHDALRDQQERPSGRGLGRTRRKSGSASPGGGSSSRTGRRSNRGGLSLRSSGRCRDARRCKCSHGNQYRDFLYVEDCADAFAALLDGLVEGPVNIASGRPVTIKEVVRTIASLIPGADAVPMEFGAVPTPQDDPPLLVADVRRLTREVGWMPQINLADGLARTIAWWQAAGCIVPLLNSTLALSWRIFTIGIPAYNRAGFLRHAIKSALDQSWPDVEDLVSRR